MDEWSATLTLDYLRFARDSGGIPRTRHDPLRTRSLLRIGE